MNRPPFIGGVIRSVLQFSWIGLLMCGLWYGGAAGLAAAVGISSGDLHATDQELADELSWTLLGASSGITIHNATFTGDRASSGTFSGGADAALGLDSGIVLTTGLANSAVLGVEEEASTDLLSGTDADLESISAGQTIHDSGVLELRFTPTMDSITMRFVFASEEWPDDWIVGRDYYYDILGFFVNGVNGALIPGTDLAISVDNIHPAIPEESLEAANPEYYLDNQAGEVGFVYDGLTPVITFTASVDPGVENTLKIAIGDGSDGLFDSAVFLETGSLRVNQPPVVDQVLVDQSATVDVAFSYEVPADAFSDPDVGDELTYTADLSDGSPLPAWLTFDPTGRTFSGTPSGGDLGTIEVRLTATDMGAAGVADTFSLVVAEAPNVAPTALDLSMNEVDQSSGIDAVVGTLSTTDANPGDTHSYSFASGAGDGDNAWFNLDGAVLRADDASLMSAGVFTIRLRTTDGGGEWLEAVFSITVVDDVAPAAPSAPDVDAADDTGASDTDNLTYVNLPTLVGTAEPFCSVGLFVEGTVSLGIADADSSGNWSFTVPDALADGVHQVTAVATDGAGNSSPVSAVLMLVVDTVAPTITSDTTAMGTYGSSFTYATVTLEAPVSFEAMDLAPGLSIDSATGEITGIPTLAGDFEATVIARDLAGNSDGILLAIEVAKASASVDLGGLTVVYDAGPQEVTASTLPEGLAVMFTYEGSATAPTSVGPYEVVATVVDSNYAGTTNGTLTIYPATLTVTAADATRVYGETNPEFTGTVDGAMPEDDLSASYVSAATAASPVGVYAIEPVLADPLDRQSNYSLSLIPGTLTVLSDGRPIVDLGTDATIYTLGDEPRILAPEVTLEGVEDPAFAGGWVQVMVVAEGDELYDGDQLQVRGDEDPSGLTVVDDEVLFGGVTIGSIEGGSELPLRVVFSDAVSVETVEYLIGRLAFWTASSTNLSARTVRFEVADGAGKEADPEEMTVAINRRPIAGFDAMITLVDRPVRIAVTLLQANDTDPDEDSFVVTGVTATGTQGGSIEADGDDLVYTPAVGFVGSDTFDYTVEDTHGGTAIGNVTVRVIPGGTLTIVRTPKLDPQDEDTVTVYQAGLPGQEYQVEVSGDLSTWQPLGTAVSDGEGMLQFTDTESISRLCRFYRLWHP